jgi:hypothetical protein
MFISYFKNQKNPVFGKSDSKNHLPQDVSQNTVDNAGKNDSLANCKIASKHVI